MKTYGTLIPNLTINGEPAPYGVLNERAIRAGAGIMFASGLIAFIYTYLTRDFTFVNIIVPIFWLDFLLKVVNPKFSFIGQLGELIVAKQKPEYVGAIQKRFAWSIGLILATVMLVFVVGLGFRGLLPFSICSICLLFMWMETSFGICIGCKMYNFLLNKKFIAQPEFKPACPGGACSIPIKK
jgi:hypothetical protein